MVYASALKLVAKIALITAASGGFGVMMGLVMSSFEFNHTMQIDTDRSTKSQLKQQFHGYGKFLKKQALSFMKFGWYISILEIPLEISLGKISTPVVFFSGGMAACLLNPKGTFKSKIPTFFGSGMFIGAIGGFMNRGNDKA